MFNTELLFFFSALGAFNGLLMSFYFIFSKSQNVAHKFLGLMLLMLSIRVGKSVFFYFNPDLDFGFLQFGLTACFFVGPFLYFYANCLIDLDYVRKMDWKLHLGFHALLAAIVGYYFPFETNLDFWRPYIINVIYFQWLFYIIISSIKLWPVISKFFSKEKDKTSVDVWVLSVLIGNTLVLISYLSFHYTYYIVGAISFSFLLYMMILLIIYRHQEKPIELASNEKYANKINSLEATPLIERLEQVMASGIYQKQDLKLLAVANEIGISSHKLSQLINGNLGKSFSHYINEKRVSAATQMIKDKHEYTLEAIGQECGFKSKSTFYAAFQKNVGTTPAQYREQFV